MPKVSDPSDPLRFLSRVELPNSPGWVLRLTASAAASGEPFEMSFADSLFAGRDGSLRAAQAQRDALASKTRRGAHVRATTVSRGRGLPSGVRLVVHVRPSGPYLLWDVLWMENEKERRKRFSVAAHGYRGGFAKAIALRELMSGLDLSGWACPRIEDVLGKSQLAKILCNQHIGNSRCR